MAQQPTAWWLEFCDWRDAFRRGRLLPWLALSWLALPLDATAQNLDAYEGWEEFEQLSSEEWHIRLRRTESSFAEAFERWNRWYRDAMAESQVSDTPGGELDIHFRLQQAMTDLFIAENHLDVLESVIDDVRVKSDLEATQMKAWDETEQYQRARVEDTSQRVANAREELLRQILAAAPKGKRTLAALEQWWHAYNEQSWEERFTADGDAGVAVIEARRKLEHACRDLSDSIGGRLSSDLVFSLDNLLNASNDDHHSHLALQAHLGEDGENPHRANADRLGGELVAIEGEHLESLKRLVLLQNAVERLRDERNVTRGSSLDRREQSPEQQFQRSQRTLAVSYSRLWEQIADLEPHLGHQAWCQVLVHGGLARLMLQQEGGVEYLRTAVSTWEGACRGTMAPYLKVPLFQAAWADALFLEASEESASLYVDFGDGWWSIDGVRLYGAGLTELSVRPGTHRFECIPHGGGDAQYYVDELQPGERALAQVVNGGMSLAPLPAGTDTVAFSGEPHPVLGGPDWYATGVIGSEEDEPDLDPHQLSSTRLHLAGVWIQHNNFPHVGVSAGFSRVISRSERLEIDLGFTQDLALGDHHFAYALDEDHPWSSRALFREWVDLRMRPRLFTSKPTLEISAGVVPPLNAAVVQLAGGWEWTLGAETGVGLHVGFVSTFWRETDPLWFEPTLAAGMTRWF